MKIRITGVDKALRHSEDLLSSMRGKVKEFMEKLAQVGIDTASARFSTAQYDGVNDVVVSSAPEWDGENKLRIYAVGNAVGFIEFGTGVHYTEPHPKAAEFGAIRGSYGYGLGRLDSWRYRGEPGTDGEIITEGRHKGMVLTHGNPPARAMYDASREMRDKIQEIAKEVFGHG